MIPAPTWIAEGEEPATGSSDDIQPRALELGRADDHDPALRDGLAGLAEAKAASVAERMAEIVGPADAAERLERIVAELRERTTTKVT